MQTITRYELHRALYRDIKIWCDRPNAVQPRHCRSPNGRINPCCCVTKTIYDVVVVPGGRDEGKRARVERKELRPVQESMELYNKMYPPLTGCIMDPSSTGALMSFMGVFEIEYAGNQYMRYRVDVGQRSYTFCRIGLGVIASIIEKYVRTFLRCPMSRSASFDAANGFERVWLFPLTARPRTKGNGSDNKKHEYFTKHCVKKTFQNRIFLCYVSLWTGGMPSSRNNIIPIYSDMEKRYKSMFNLSEGKEDCLRYHQGPVNRFVKKSELVVVTGEEGRETKINTKGRKGYFVPENKRWEYHEWNCHGGRVAIGVVEEIGEIVKKSYDSMGNKIRMYLGEDCQTLATEMKPSGISTKCMRASWKWAQVGIGPLFDDNIGCFKSVSIYKKFEEEISHKIRKFIQRDSSLDLRALNMTECISFWVTKSNMNTTTIDDVSICCRPKLLYDMKQEGIDLFVSWIPLGSSGMWLRIVRENKFDPLNVESRRYLPKEIGTWIYIPYGSMLTLPASVYQSSAFRTSLDGNPRMSVYSLLWPKGREYPIGRGNILGLMIPYQQPWWQMYNGKRGRPGQYSVKEVEREEGPAAAEEIATFVEAFNM